MENSVQLSRAASKYFLLFLGLCSYYAGSLSIVLWSTSLVFLLLFFRRTTTSVLILICTLTLYFLVRLLLESDKLYQLIQDIRYFWGFIFFYIFFLSERLHNPLSENNYHAFFKIVVNVLIVLLFIEFLTSNLFSFLWPNRQHYFLEEIRENAIARAYGFGGNATVTSVLIISLTTLLYQGYIRDFLVLLLSISATGFTTLVFKFIFKQRRLITLILATPILILLFHLLGFVANAIDYPALHRLSINYFLSVVSG
jgi:hypothetical protein